MAEKVSALKRNIFYGLLCWKKSYIAKLLMSGKKIISPEVWGKKNLTKPNHPSPPPPPLPPPPPSKSSALPLTKFSCSDGLPISIIGMGIRYKNWLAMTSLHGKVTKIV